MLLALSRIFKKDLIKVFSLTAISTFVKMLAGFLSIKIISGLIGPSGIALLGQLNNLSSIFLTISTGGINNGVTKYVAQFSGEREQLSLFLRSTFWITIIMSITAGSILIIGSDYFSKLILKDTAYSSIVVVFGFTLIFYSFNSILLSILNGFKEYKTFVLINVVTSLVGLCCSISLSFYFGIHGALLSAITFEALVFAVCLVIISKKPWIKQKLFLGKFDVKAGQKLAHYSLMAFTSASTVPVGQLIIRSHIVNNGSLTDAGLWEGMNRISGMYLFVIISSLGVYYLPRLSELKSDTDLKNEIVNTYKIVLPPLAFMLAGIFILRDYLIPFLFNQEFIEMRNLFLFQVVGDFIKIASWILSYQMIAKSMTKTFILTEVCGVFTYVFLSLVLINYFGTRGATMAHAISNMIYLTVMIVIFRKILFR